MRFHGLWLLVGLTVLLTLQPSKTLTAGEPYLQFTQALRDRGYADTALDYLDIIEKSPETPPEIVTMIPFDRAITLLSASKIAKASKDKLRMLDRAEVELRRFLMAVDEAHPSYAPANFELGSIYMFKAVVQILESNKPANAGEKTKYQLQAREHLAEASKIFTTALEKYQAIFDTFPTFIPDDQKEDLEKRAAAEGNLMRAKLELAKTRYQEAQTWDRESPQFGTILDKAAEEFEKIHARHRSQVGGLHARMWQGKCFEEKNEIGKALGFYNELLSHPGTSTSLKRLQDDVRHFRLICLNHEKREDYYLVIQEAGEWLKENRRRDRSQTGLGIRWQRAVAFEKLGENVDLPTNLFAIIIQSYELLNMEANIPRGEQEEFFQKALEDAEHISLSSGRYRDVAQSMVERLEVLLNRKAGDPDNFRAAFGLARSLLKKIDQQKQVLKTTPDSAVKAEAQEEFDRLTDRIEHILSIGLELAVNAEPAPDPETIHLARYRLAYVHFLKQNYYDAIVICDYVARVADRDTSVALDAAYLSLSSFIRAYNALEKADRDFEQEQLIVRGEFLTSRWAESDKANLTRIQLGALYKQQNKPALSAEWYSKVPKDSSQYATAQLEAGQAYLAAYGNLAGSGDVSPDELQQWLDQSEKHLREGVSILSQQIPENSKAPEELIAAKLSLVEIIVPKGQNDVALQLLIGGIHPILPAVKVEDESRRPEDGVTSRGFAMQAHRMLLRTYINVNDVDKALEAMTELEAIAEAGDDPQRLVEVYDELGREVKKEMDRLRSVNDTKRLAEMRVTFDKFLTELFKRKDQLTYRTLIWMAQTYVSLGEGTVGEDIATATAEEKQQAMELFGNAADTYQGILKLASEKPDDVPANALPAIRLGNIRSLRLSQRFQEAFDGIERMLKADPLRLGVQKEAAFVAQDWATYGGGDSYKKYPLAIGRRTAIPEGLPMWGWAGIAIKISELIHFGKGTEVHDEYLREAWYYQYWCLHQYAMKLNGNARQAELSQAKIGLHSFVRQSGDLPEKWRNDFNKLYHQVQLDMGIANPEDLPAYEPPRIVPTTNMGKKADEKTEKKVAVKKPKNEEKKKAGTSPVVFGVLGLIGLAAIGGMVFMMSGSSKKRRPTYVTETAPVLPGGQKTRPQQTRTQQSKSQQARSTGEQRPSAPRKKRPPQ